MDGCVKEPQSSFRDIQKANLTIKVMEMLKVTCDIAHYTVITHVYKKKEKRKENLERKQLCIEKLKTKSRHLSV